MADLESINEENFKDSFDIDNLLKDSIYYPSSGVDGRPIDRLKHISNSFIYVDYSRSRDTVYNALSCDFESLGYDVVGIRDIGMEEITPGGFTPSPISREFTEQERQRFNFYERAMNNLTPFALWAVFKLNPDKTHKTGNKINKFSILHIGGEGCATYDALYVNKKRNPLGIAIYNSGEGYGDNWTQYRDTSAHFYRLLEYNENTNKVPFPELLATNMDGGGNFWPDKYFFSQSLFGIGINTENLYERRY